jgi:hypothetical protein
MSILILIEIRSFNQMLLRNGINIVQNRVVRMWVDRIPLINLMGVRILTELTWVELGALSSLEIFITTGLFGFSSGQVFLC